MGYRCKIYIINIKYQTLSKLIWYYKDFSIILNENGILFSKDQKMLIVYPSGLTAETYIIPEGVEVIDAYSFLEVN